MPIALVSIRLRVNPPLIKVCFKRSVDGGLNLMSTLKQSPAWMLAQTITNGWRIDAISCPTILMVLSIK